MPTEPTELAKQIAQRIRVIRERLHDANGPLMDELETAERMLAFERIDSTFPDWSWAWDFGLAVDLLFLVDPREKTKEEIISQLRDRSVVMTSTDRQRVMEAIKYRVEKGYWVQVGPDKKSDTMVRPANLEERQARNIRLKNRR